MTTADRDPLTIAREVLETAHEDETVTVCSVPDNKTAALARAVLAVSELHQPIRVYDECLDAECRNDHIELVDYWGCDSTVIGWACDECCYDNGNPLECKKHGGDHAGVTADQACSIRAALNGETHA
ncbi:hypothetical protein [Micrococcus luteus]|uniref:hypothetical protein n=1 Tax=Micrococcus luteus TaxID=1270 RepID=UPI0023041D15|nr:hypothetical protein [Micrococcus luteus]